MTKPKPGFQRVIAKDKYGNKVFVYGYTFDGGDGYDLNTDGRVLLTPAFARRLIAALKPYAEVTPCR